MSDRDFGVSTKSLTVLVYVVTFCWVGNLFAPLLITTYQGNTGVNGIMGAIIGLLGAARFQASRNRAQEIPGDQNE